MNLAAFSFDLAVDGIQPKSRSIWRRDGNVCLALRLLAGAGSIATRLVLWWSWHRLEVVTPARRELESGTAVAATDAAA
jgi:hypothetical protein